MNEADGVCVPEDAKQCAHDEADDGRPRLDPLVSEHKPYDDSGADQPAKIKNSMIIVKAWAGPSRNVPRVIKPAPETVNQGYNEKLDEARPKAIDQYLT